MTADQIEWNEEQSRKMADLDQTVQEPTKGKPKSCSYFVKRQ